MRGNCVIVSFVDIGGIYWPSLFKISFHNWRCIIVGYARNDNKFDYLIYTVFKGGRSYNPTVR